MHPCHYVTSVNIKLSQLVGYIACEDYTSFVFQREPVLRKNNLLYNII